MDNSYKSYINQILNYPLLTAQEESELSYKIQADDDSNARMKLIQSNLRLVVNIAHKYISNSSCIMDVIQEGNIGLMVAASKYHYSYKTRFSTYAYAWITQSILRYIQTKTQIISLPVRKEDLMYKIKTAKAELFQRSNTNPSDLEISVYTGIPLKMIEDTHSYDFSIASIDADVNNNSGQTLGDMLADVNQSPEDEVLREDKRKQIVNLVQMLPHNERIVIQNRYCLFSSEKKTLRQIGKILCLSPETVRQTEKRAIKKMRVVVDANSELYAI